MSVCLSPLCLSVCLSVCLSLSLYYLLGNDKLSFFCVSVCFPLLLLVLAAADDSDYSIIMQPVICLKLMIEQERESHVNRSIRRSVTIQSA